MRPGDRRARRQQDQRVEQRQMPRIEHLDALRRPVTAGEFDARVLDRLAGEEARVEKGPEPRDEEHHFRGDEQDHPVAVRELHDAGVEAPVLGLTDDVGPPRDHRVEHADQARAEDIGTGFQSADRQPLHEHDRADGHHERGNRIRPAATGSDQPGGNRGSVWRDRRPSSFSSSFRRRQRLHLTRSVSRRKPA